VKARWTPQVRAIVFKYYPLRRGIEKICQKTGMTESQVRSCAWKIGAKKKRKKYTTKRVYRRPAKIPDLVFTGVCPGRGIYCGKKLHEEIVLEDHRRKTYDLVCIVGHRWQV